MHSGDLKAEGDVTLGFFVCKLARRTGKILLELQDIINPIGVLPWSFLFCLRA